MTFDAPAVRRSTETYCSQHEEAWSAYRNGSSPGLVEGIHLSEELKFEGNGGRKRLVITRGKMFCSVEERKEDESKRRARNQTRHIVHDAEMARF